MPVMAGRPGTPAPELTVRRLRHRMLFWFLLPPNDPLGYLAGMPCGAAPGAAAFTYTAITRSVGQQHKMGDHPRLVPRLSASFRTIRCQRHGRPYTVHGNTGTEAEGLMAGRRRRARRSRCGAARVPGGARIRPDHLTQRSPGRPSDGRPCEGVRRPRSWYALSGRYGAGMERRRSRSRHGRRCMA